MRRDRADAERRWSALAVEIAVALAECNAVVEPYKETSTTVLATPLKDEVPAISEVCAWPDGVPAPDLLRLGIPLRSQLVDTTPGNSTINLSSDSQHFMAAGGIYSGRLRVWLKSLKSRQHRGENSQASIRLLETIRWSTPRRAGTARTCPS